MYIVNKGHLTHLSEISDEILTEYVHGSILFPLKGNPRYQASPTLDVELFTISHLTYPSWWPLM